MVRLASLMSRKSVNSRDHKLPESSLKIPPGSYPGHRTRFPLLSISRITVPSFSLKL
jgi:hypothetical protein